MLKTILTTALLAAAFPAAAQTEQVTHEVRVSYSDLDLSQPGDVKKLDHRLHVAIGQVCPDTEPQDRLIAFSVLHCRHAAHVKAADQRAAALAAAATRTRLASSADAR